MNPQPEQNWNDPEPIAESSAAACGQIAPAQQSDNSTGHPSSPGPATTPESIPNSERRPRGKIGRFSKADRDRLNFMLRDGLFYPDVINQLGQTGKNLTPRNVGDWFNGAAYQQWLKDQDWREDIRADQEAGLDLIPDFDAGKFNEAALQVVITHLFRALRHLGSTPMKDHLGGDIHNFARLVHALARASRETINLQKHREAGAKAAATDLKNLDPNRDLSDTEYALLVNKMDQVFKVARPKPQSTSAAERLPDSPHLSSSPPPA